MTAREPGVGWAKDAIVRKGEVPGRGPAPCAPPPSSSTMPRSWVLEDPGRPMPMNEYRTLHHHARARYDREVRQRFGWLAKLAHVPRLVCIQVSAAPIVRRKPLPDVGACFPAAKAAIDGLVDVGVVPDDCSPYLAGLTFLPPEIADRDALVLIVVEFPISEGDHA